ncbi:EAL domain-containing protein [Stenomitos frigidus]|uniref:EAL domain-containing protein n=1 Tax=Stenomitos frigidus ULC18 TaxID=2107698 RepID=A0A2T1EJ75_9CYAN|nr:EAL domain-containing protein [Stenomitos frigidus]PSB32796.1 EAL domain-containing protein [Stenomitos frigidus ULC18]
MALIHPETILTDPLKLIVQPHDLKTVHALDAMGFQPLPLVPQLVYLVTTRSQLAETFLGLSETLSEVSQLHSRYCLTRSPLDSKALLVEFLSAQPLNTITESARYAWFLQVLAKQSFFFKYQPIFDLQRGHVTAYECLARARCEQGRSFSGQQLIDAAQSLKLMREFDDTARVVCIEAIAQLRSTQALRFPDAEPPTFFINVLPNTIIHDPNAFEQTFQQAIDLGLRPQQIVFELTEVESLLHSSELHRMISLLREWGFRFAVDDLCGNVSADHYFMEFQPDVIKIDRQLVSGCGQHPLKQVLLKSLLQSAHELNIEVLAEGLETITDIEFCRTIGIDYGQGFGLALPERTLQTKPLNLLKFAQVS